MALDPKRSNTSSWGVRGVFASDFSSGVVVSGKITVSETSEPIKNVYGAIVKRIVYDYTVSSELMALVKSDAQPPKIGESMTVNFTTGQSVTGYVARCAVVETNQSFRKIAIIVESHCHCNSPNKEASVSRISGDSDWQDPDFDFRA